METPRNLDRLFGRLAASLRAIAGKLRREKPPVMLGLPPSARGLKAIPDDIEEQRQRLRGPLLGAAGGHRPQANAGGGRAGGSDRDARHGQ